MQPGGSNRRAASFDPLYSFRDANGAVECHAGGFRRYDESFHLACCEDQYESRRLKDREVVEGFRLGRSW
jgi:hypothetical protein